jgi:hypothetical protein
VLGKTPNIPGPMGVAITTRRKLWSFREERTKPTSMGSLAIWLMTSTSLGMTTLWSHFLRPSSLRQSTSRPSRMSLNRKLMNTMRRLVHVPPARLGTPSLISLPPKAKCNQMHIPVTIFIMKPHLSLGWNLFVEVGLFGWLRSSWRGDSRDVEKGVKCLMKVVRFWTPPLFLRRGSHMLLNHSIFHSMGGSFRWNELDKFGVVEGFLRVSGHCTHQPYQIKWQSHP